MHNIFIEANKLKIIRKPTRVTKGQFDTSICNIELTCVSQPPVIYEQYSLNQRGRKNTSSTENESTTEFIVCKRYFLVDRGPFLGPRVSSVCDLG